jgi:hypothetical protein
LQFYLDLIATSENVSLLYHLANKGKTVRDAESHTYSVVFPLIDSNSVFVTDPMQRIFTLYASLLRPSSRLGHKLNHGYFPAILAKSNFPPISSDPYPMQQQQTKCGIQSVIRHKKTNNYDTDLEDGLPTSRHDFVAQREIQAWWC